MGARRVLVLYLLLAVVAVAAISAWLAGYSVESPAEAAARTAPPSPSPILVPVERRVLSSDVVTRGTVRFGLPQPVSIAPSVLKANPGLIATLPLRNAQIQEGQVLLTASGRPVFVLAGRVPAYRDLAPGTTGADVRQLEEALARLGFDPGPADGVYDQRTGEAVAAWYTARGWEPFGPTPDQIAALRVLEREWADATRQRLAATAAAASAAEAVGAARATAEQGWRAAALEQAARGDDRSQLAEASQRGASRRVESERARVQHAEAAAAAEIATRTAERALIVLDPRQPETARINADAQLELARAARRRAQLEGEQAIRLAEREAEMATERVRLADAAQRAARLEGAKAVRAATDAQRLADFDARLATERADRVAADLEQARRRLGVQVPVDEIVFIPSFPVRVEEVTATIASRAAGPVLSVTDNQLSIDSALPIEVAPLVRPGMRVSVDERALGVRASGVVQAVANTPGTRGVDGFHFHLEVRVEETPTRLDGFSVRLTIPIQSTRGAVLAVPVSAVSLAADGSSRIQIEASGGLEYVTVTPGLAAGGYVEITPVNGKVEAGQLVVVGDRNGAPAPPGAGPSPPPAAAPAPPSGTHGPAGTSQPAPSAERTTGPLPDRAAGSVPEPPTLVAGEQEATATMVEAAPSPAASSLAAGAPAAEPAPVENARPASSAGPMTEPLPARAIAPIPEPPAPPAVWPAATAPILPPAPAVAEAELRPADAAAAASVPPPRTESTPPAAPAPGPVAAALPAPSPPPTPAPAASAPPPSAPSLAPTLSPALIAALIQRGDAMLANGDISAARLLYERAANAGSAEAAAAAGRTYDPRVLAAISARGIRPDPAAAAAWYRRAAALGDATAERLLQAMAPTGSN